MAQITFRPHPSEYPPAMQLLINGVDVSMETYPDIEIVTVGDDPATAEVGLRVTFAVTDLTIGDIDPRDERAEDQVTRMLELANAVGRAGKPLKREPLVQKARKLCDPTPPQEF